MEGLGLGISPARKRGPEAVPPRTTAAPVVRVRASVVLGKIESRPPRRLGLPSRGAELDSSASPRLRGDLGLRGVPPPPPTGGGRTWEQDVGVQWHGLVCRELWCL